MNIDHHHEIEEEILISDHWRTLKRHKWTALTILFNTVLIVSIVSIMMKPVYRATATLLIDQETSNVLTISENNMALGAQSYATYKEYFLSQKEIIKSRGIIEQVFKEFKLDETEEYAVKNASFKDFIREFLGKGESASSAEKKQDTNQIDLVAKFIEHITVIDVRNTRLLKLSVENTDPVLAADIANRIAQIYVERNLAYISKNEILDLHKNEYLKLQAKLSEYSKIYKHMHPKIIRVKEKMEEVTKKIKQERDENIPGATPVISTSDLTSLKANNVSVQDWAEPAFIPIKPNKRKNVLLSIIVGLFAGVGMAFLLESLDNTIKSADEIGRRTGWPFLGYIPMVRKSGKKLALLVHSKPKSALSETYRTIRTGLLFSSTPEYHLKSVLIASPGEQEGKSTTVSNLAIAMAQNNKKVLLVDADMRKPYLHRVYKADNKKGLSTYLSGQTSFEKIVHETHIENLSFIGCGPFPPDPSELLASKKMEEFITYAKGKFDYIFFDTPPIMVVTDAVVLSKIVDGTIIVMESGRSSRKIIPMLRQKLNNSKARVIGFIINKIKSQNGEYEHFYEYYTRYHGRERINFFKKNKLKPRG
ncbi:MAG: polysaccharide biosynthesis tyrosine autokinase [Candidatus Omnitrophica bacterium]|nr:polysaccharide biosynthesis tyrosine autokinase [Candidatus Omnitrophota bacterium]